MQLIDLAAPTMNFLKGSQLACAQYFKSKKLIQVDEYVL